MKKKLFKNVTLFLMIALMMVSLAGYSALGEKAEAPVSPDTASAGVEQAEAEAEAFPKFQGTDFEGNAVDESMFGKNAVTLVNFWFNGCPACVDEMPTLEKLNQQLREKGSELVGVNIEAHESEGLLKEAREILAKQGATYKNILLTGGKEISDYINGLYGFPTTVLVDRNGNIVGEPILGSIDDDEKVADILKMVDDAAAGKAVSPITEENSGDDIYALVNEENDVFSNHEDMWNKVLGEVTEEYELHLEQDEYIPYLKEKVEQAKASLTEEELKLLNEDIQKIEAIEEKLKALEAAEQ